MQAKFIKDDNDAAILMAKTKTATKPTVHTINNESNNNRVTKRMPDQINLNDTAVWGIVKESSLIRAKASKKVKGKGKGTATGIYNYNFNKGL